MYPINMVVRGDHTVLGKTSKTNIDHFKQGIYFLALHLAVVPSQTEAVIFSIGTFVVDKSPIQFLIFLSEPLHSIFCRDRNLNFLIGKL